MANIGNLAVQLSLDAALFTQGIDRATKEGKAFASDFTSTFAGIGAGITALEGIGSAASGLYGGLKSDLNNIVEQGRAADRLGLSLEKMAGINRLLGPDAEAAGHAFQHFSAHISEAAAGSAEAMKPFKQIGIDVKDLGGSLDDSLGKVLDKLKRFNTNNRNDIAMELFGGREGAKIVADIAGGSKGIAESVAAIEAHGGIALDTKGATEAARALDEMEASWKRIELRLVSDVAPAVEKVANAIADAASAAAKLEKVGERIATSKWALPIIAGGIVGLNTATAVLATSGAVALNAIAPLPPELGDTGGGGSFEQDLKLDNAKDYTTEIKRLEDTLRSQVATFGMGAEAAERFKLSIAGVTDEQLKNIDSSISELSQMKSLTEEVGRGATIFEQAGSKFADTFAAIGKGNLNLGDGLLVLGKQFADFNKKLDSSYDKIAADARSPLDRFKDEMAELNRLHDIGDSRGNKLTDDQYALALADDFKKIVPPLSSIHAPGALEQGSMEAHSAEVSFGRQDMQQSVPDLLKEIKEQAAQQLEQAKQLVAQLKKQTSIVDDRLVGRPIQ